MTNSNILLKPKISSKAPFDYEKLKNTAKYMYVAYDGSSRYANRPYVVTEENGNQIKGHIISIFYDGIESNADFTTWKDSFYIQSNTDSFTQDIDQGICDWLKSVGHTELIESIEETKHN